MIKRLIESIKNYLRYRKLKRLLKKGKDPYIYK